MPLHLATMMAIDKKEDCLYAYQLYYGDTIVVAVNVYLLQ